MSNDTTEMDTSSIHGNEAMISLAAIMLSDMKILMNHFLRFMAVSCGFLPGHSGDTFLRFRWRVTATAMELFKRFYINNSLVAFDPRIMM